MPIPAMNTIQDSLTVTFRAGARKSKLFIVPIRFCYSIGLELELHVQLHSPRRLRRNRPAEKGRGLRSNVRDVVGVIQYVE